MPGPAGKREALVVVVEKEAVATERAAAAEKAAGEAAVTYEEVAAAAEAAIGLRSSGELSQAALGPSGWYGPRPAVALISSAASMLCLLLHEDSLSQPMPVERRSGRASGDMFALLECRSSIRAAR